MIAIGSKSLLHRLHSTPDVDKRVANSDYDIIMSLEEFATWQSEYKDYIRMLIPRGGNKYKAILDNNRNRKQYEIELGIEGTSSALLLNNSSKVCDGIIQGFLNEELHTLNPQYQLLTKRSHLIYPVHFEKNIGDYHTLRSLVGEFDRDELMEVYYSLRRDEAKKRYKQRTPSLNVSNEDFFSSKLIVKTYFVHDHIHQIVKHHDKPVYEMMKKNTELAWCEKDMFFSLSYEYQVQAIQEEAMTIALERYILPQYGDDWSDHFSCYKKAVKRICTTLCSGWFRDFAIENYPKVIEWYDSGFVEKFDDAFKRGDIKLKENANMM